MKLENHPAADIFPMMSEDKLQQMAEDIKKQGQLIPCVVQGNVLLDGRNRVAACLLAGVEPVLTEYEGDDPIAFVASVNGNRRDHSKSQRACFAVEFEALFAEEARKRMQIRKGDQPGATPETLPDLSYGEARDQAGQVFRVSGRMVSTAKTIKSTDPNLFDLVKAGKITLSSAHRQLRNEWEALRQEEQSKVVAALLDGFISDETGEIESGWYKAGSQFLYCGSNLDPDFIEGLPQAALAFADPPYNAGVDEWDQGFVWQQDYLQDFADVVAVTPGGWNAAGFYKETQMRYVWEIACWITNGMTHGRCGYANWIKTSIFSKGQPKFSQDHFRITISTSETTDTSHRGRKPYAYMAQILDLFTKRGDDVIDPFAGSGTTLLMCEKTGRTSYNAELNPEYCKAILGRIIGMGGNIERV